MKKVLIIFIVCLVMCGCSNNQNNSGYSFNMEEIKDIMANNNYVIIDVRTQDEYNSSHLSGAINISYDEINENIEIDKTSVIFVYCKSGNRSKIAYEKLLSLGYTVYDLGSYQNIDLPKE